MSTIPANLIVDVVPSVLSAGGTGLNGIGLMLSNDPRIPIGAVLSFSSATAVAAYFGASSAKVNEAAIYFAGFSGASIQPSQLLMAQYNQNAVAAFERGGSVAGLTLAQLQALSGTLAITVDGYARSGGTISLAAATSPSNAASIIQSALNAGAPTEASITGSISGSVLTVTAVASGIVGAGQTVSGTGGSTGLYLTSQLSGSIGGTGTYQLSGTGAYLSEPLTLSATNVAVTYDSISGGFVITSGVTGAISTIAYATGTLAALLNLTLATGAVISQGAAAATPSAFMNALIVQNSAWVNFMTLFDPDNGSGNTQKQLFAAWKNTALGGNRFGYFCWDPDESPAASSDATASLGQILMANGDSGTFLIWEGGATADNGLCAFVLGMFASVNYEQTNGRITAAFKSQPGLTANVTDPTTAGNLLANGYNFYGAYGAANEGFIWLQEGTITGPFEWADSYENQIWLNSFFQQQLLALLQNTLSVPFSNAGAALITAACNTVIQAGLAFRAFGPDNLSPAQIAEVNNAAGANIATTLQQQGYYLQVNLPPATVRAARGPWPITFWYIDQGAVQKINLSSVLVQ